MTTSSHRPGCGGTGWEVNTRLLAALEEHSLAFSRPWTAADEPGRMVTELTVGQGALGLDPSAVAGHLAALLD